jgi:hypothetical protein
LIGIRRRWPDRCRLLALAWGLALGAGCNVAGFVAQAIPQKVKAVHRLEPRPTLVLVDDPSNHLGDPTLVGLIAAETGALMVEHRAVEVVVPPEKVDALYVSLGDAWARTGIDQIGRAVGADQVVHLHIDAAALYSVPGLFEPNATVQVKVIDVVHRKRLFPASAEGGDSPGFSLTPQGHRLLAKLPPRGTEPSGYAAQREAMRVLCMRIARDASRLFYDYLPRQPGEPFE